MEQLEYEIHKSSETPKYKKLNEILLYWINSTLIRKSQVVRDLCEDLADGQILAAFLEQIVGETIPNTVRVTTDKSKRVNLSAVLRFIETKLNIPSNGKWSLDGILNKDYSSILRLLVDLAHSLKCPYSLPSDISIAVTIIEKISTGGVKKKTTVHKITEDELIFQNNEAAALAIPQDEEIKPESVSTGDKFEEIFLDAEKIDQLTNILTEFVNSNLSELGITIEDIGNDFHDGVKLIFLLGILGEFFVPLYLYKMEPKSTDDKIQNVRTALQLMDDLDIDVDGIHINDIVNKDKKSNCKCLYSIFLVFTEETEPT
ncbi:hypothetical protein HK098_005535 [Nowakowskiella sp. JEL0407]|nr:hypothetical protein HK098_005535 [Nowakowskiella sp. JEL0407]